METTQARWRHDAPGVGTLPPGPPRRKRTPGRRAERDGEARTLDALAASSALLQAHLEPPSPRDSVRRRTLALADVAAIALAGGAAVAIGGTRGAGSSWLLLLTTIPLWVVLNKLLGLYDRDAHVLRKSTLDELPRLLQSIALGAGGAVLVAPLLGDPALTREHAIAFGVAAAMLVPLSRWNARALVTKRYAPERALVIGSGPVAWLVADKVRAHPEDGVELVGYVDGSGQDLLEGQLPHLGDLSSLEDVCRRHEVERVIIAFSSMSHERLLDVIRASKVLGLKITVVPRLFEMLGHAVELDQVQGMTLLGLRGLGRTRSSLAAKRVIDVVLSAVALVSLAPLLLLIAAAIKLTSRGPVFFRQQRMGRRNDPFELLKFRTMVVGADEMKSSLAHLNEAQAPMFKMTRDPRVIPVGRLLRRTSLDELPQLWNVLRGDMSLVGPRPLVRDENDHLIGWHRARLELTPGLTGPWQVLGRTAIPFAEMVKLDYHYVADWSLWNDIKLLVRTIRVVVGGKGA